MVTERFKQGQGLRPLLSYARSHPDAYQGLQSAFLVAYAFVFRLCWKSLLRLRSSSPLQVRESLPCIRLSALASWSLVSFALVSAVRRDTIRVTVTGWVGRGLGPYFFVLSLLRKVSP